MRYLIRDFVKKLLFSIFVVFQCTFFIQLWHKYVNEKKIKYNSVGYRLRCVHCIALTIYVQLLSYFKLLRDNLLCLHLQEPYEQNCVSFSSSFHWFFLVSCLKLFVPTTWGTQLVVWNYLFWEVLCNLKLFLSRVSLGT